MLFFSLKFYFVSEIMFLFICALPDYTYVIPSIKFGIILMSLTFLPTVTAGTVHMCWF